ncbi:MAG: AAA family ATPase [Patescibacteria group bacterium]
MSHHLLIIFGKPGAGKSYVADIAAHSFGYFSHNGDTDIPTDMKDALFQKKEITDTMRRQFLDTMITSITTLLKTHDNLAVHQTFIKKFMRKKVLDAFPYAKFILVEADDAIREKRYMKREYFNLGLPYLRRMTDLFEPVQISHTIVKNNDEGAENVTAQLEKIIRGNL